jgi:hypothetical protein
MTAYTPIQTLLINAPVILFLILSTVLRVHFIQNEQCFSARNNMNLVHMKLALIMTVISI